MVLVGEGKRLRRIKIQNGCGPAARRYPPPSSVPPPPTVPGEFVKVAGACPRVRIPTNGRASGRDRHPKGEDGEFIF